MTNFSFPKKPLSSYQKPSTLLRIIRRAEEFGYTEYANVAKKRFAQVMKRGEYYLTIKFTIAFDLYSRIQKQLRKKQSNVPRLSRMLENHDIREAMSGSAQCKKYSQGFLTLAKYVFLNFCQKRRSADFKIGW